MKILYVFLISFLATTVIHAQSNYTLFEESSSIIITGTSSVHDWDMRVDKFTGTGIFSVVDSQLEGITSFTIAVETASLKSGKRIMDGKAKSALDAKKQPLISFSFKEMIEISSDSITVLGDLKIAGFTKEIALIGAYQIGANGSIVVSGTHNINMTEYGVKPPTAMLGTLKTGEEVVIEFNVSFQIN